MATLDLDLFSFSAVPDDADDDVTFAPYMNFGGAGNTDRMVLVFFDGSVKTNFFFGFVMPPQFVGTPKVVVQWDTQATTGDVVFDCGLRGIKPNNSEISDPTSYAETKTVTDSATATAQYLSETEMAFTASNFQIGDLIIGAFARDKVDANDTLADEAVVHSLRFTFTDV